MKYRATAGGMVGEEIRNYLKSKSWRDEQAIVRAFILL